LISFIALNIILFDYSFNLTMIQTCRSSMIWPLILKVGYLIDLFIHQNDENVTLWKSMAQRPKSKKRYEQ